jgi:hypothetical protein
MRANVNPSEYVRQPYEHGGNIDGPHMQHEHFPVFRRRARVAEQ